MSNNLSKDDLSELERRRLTDAVTESVERTLRTRYTWLAIVVSFLIGGTVATAALSLMSGAKEALIETEIFLNQSKQSTDRSKKFDGASKARL